MKKLITILILCVVIGCDVRTQEPEEPQAKESKRINFLDHSGNIGYAFQIIEVDSHQYIFSYEGGGIHLQSCQCLKVNE